MRARSHSSLVRLLAASAGLAFVLGLVSLALIAVVAVFAPVADARAGEGYASPLLLPGMEFSALGLLAHNAGVLALYAIIVGVGARRAVLSVSRSAGGTQALAGVRPAQAGERHLSESSEVGEARVGTGQKVSAVLASASARVLAVLGLRARPWKRAVSSDRLVIGCALVAVVVAALGHAWQLGQTLGGTSIIWRIAPTELMPSLVHGPAEMMALSLPLAALLIGLPRKHRAMLPRLLACSLLLALLLLGVAGLIEAQVTPGLVQASWKSAPYVR